MNGERLGLSLGGSGRTRTSDIICILSHYTDRSSQLRYGTMCVLLLPCTFIPTYTTHKIRLYCRYIYYTRACVCVRDLE